MLPPLKLNDIDREHLQELYDAAGVARDQLPYTETFESIWQGFQDRTFKNAEREQLFGAIIKYVRSSSNAATELPPTSLSDEQLKQLKAMITRHTRSAAKLLPYSEEFEALRSEFNKTAGTDLNERDLWIAIQRSQGPKRKPPTRTKAKVARESDDDEDGE
jgi:hypothetical protein